MLNERVNVMDWINWGISVIGVIGALFSIVAGVYSFKVNQQLKKEKLRQNKKIPVQLVYGSKTYELPVGIRRAEFSRSEVLGYLGMLPMKDKGNRFSVGYLNTAQFFFRLNEILEGNGDSTLQIPCTEMEFNQFDLDAVQK